MCKVNKPCAHLVTVLLGRHPTSTSTSFSDRPARLVPSWLRFENQTQTKFFFFCVCVCVFSCVCFGHCFAVVLVVAKIRPPSSLCSPAFFASSALWGFIFFPRGGLWLQEPFVLNLFFKWQFAPTKYTQSLAGQVVTVVMAAQAKQQQQPHHMAAARRGQGGEQQ